MSRPPSISRATTPSINGKELSVQVAVRVRPITQADLGSLPSRFQRIVVTTSPHVPNQIHVLSSAAQGNVKPQAFTFDHVYGPDATQTDIYEDSVDSLIHKFIEGYNVTILAYGQTSSGKSYTMGTTGDPAVDKGIIPHAVKSIFNQLNSMAGQYQPSGLRPPSRFGSNSNGSNTPKSKFSFSAKVSFVELYNEDLLDLLSDSDMRGLSASERHSLVQIREDPKGNIIWSGLRELNVSSLHDVMAALHRGSLARQTGSTDMNAQSSRSHAIFSLTLTQSKLIPRSSSGLSNSSIPRPGTPTTRGGPPKRSSTPGPDEGDWVTTISKFHFVDLAGSERLKRTSAVGERVKEGISINSGLHALGNVISALGDPSKARNGINHIPYRDSKLTRLLQDSLGGNAQTLMIACVSPAEYNLSETLNTLKYANRARNIKNTATINQVEAGWDDLDYLQNMVTKLRAEIKALRENGGLSRTSMDGSPLSLPYRDSINGGDRDLLQLQEAYATLSQRYAKLTAELAKYQQLPGINDQSFAEAVEPVVEEYEKSISALESQLALTRAALSHSEDILAESEARLHFADSVNDTNAGVIAELKSRLAKISEREKTTEAYVRDLELRMKEVDERHEKSNVAVQELQRELGKWKDVETDREEYINELESRLANSEENATQLKEQVERLEKQMTRRDEAYAELEARLKAIDEGSIGNEKMLLSELDERERKIVDLESKVDQLNDLIASLYREKERWEKQKSVEIRATQNSKTSNTEIPTDNEIVDKSSDIAKFSPTNNNTFEELGHLQNQYEQLQQTHKITTSRLDDITQRYEQCLAEIEELQHQLTDSRLLYQNGHLEAATAGVIAVSEQKVKDDDTENDASTEKKLTDLPNGHFLPQGRQLSLSEELSLAGQSQVGSKETPTISNNKHVAIAPSLANILDQPDAEAREREIARLQREIDHLNALQAEKSKGLEIVQSEYAKLQLQHRETLETVEELKTEIERAKDGTRNAKSNPSSPLVGGNVTGDNLDVRSPSAGTSVFLRRKSSLSNISVDPVSRSLTTLSHQITQLCSEGVPGMEGLKAQMAILKENMSAKTAVMKSLEDEVSGYKKELLSRTRMVEGLRKERMSLVGLQQREQGQVDFNGKTSPALAMTMVGGAVALEEKLREKEKELADIQVLFETAQQREESLRTELARKAKELEEIRAESGEAGKLSNELANVRNELMEREKIESALVSRIKTLESRLSSSDSPKSMQLSLFTPDSDAPPVPPTPMSPAFSDNVKSPSEFPLRRSKSVKQVIERIETSKKYEDEFMTLKKEANQAGARIAELEVELEAMRKTMSLDQASVGDDVGATAEQLVQYKKHHAELQAKLAVHEASNKEYDDVREQLKSAQKEIELFKENEQKLSNTIQTLEARISEVEALEKDLAAKKEALDQQTTKMSAIEQDINSAKDGAAKLMEENQSLVIKLDEASLRHSEIFNARDEALAKVQILQRKMASSDGNNSVIQDELDRNEFDDYKKLMTESESKRRELQKQHEILEEKIKQAEIDKEESVKKVMAAAQTEYESFKKAAAAEREELERQVSLSKELIANLESNMQSKHVEIERLEKEKTGVDSRHAELELQYEKLNAERQNTGGKLVEVTTMLNELQEEHARVKSDADTKAKSIDANEEARSKNFALQMEDMQKVSLEYRARIAELEDSIDKADAARREHMELSEQLRRELEKTQNELHAVATEFAQESERFEEHERLANQRQSRIIQLERDLAVVSRNSEDMSNGDARNLQSKISDLEGELTRERILNRNYRDSVVELKGALDSLITKSGSSNGQPYGHQQLKNISNMETIPEEHSLTERLSAMEAENVRLQQTTDELLLERRDLGTALDEVTQQNASLFKQIELMKESANGQGDIYTISQLHEQNTRLEMELNTLQQKSLDELESLRVEIKRLVEANEKLESHHHHSHVSDGSGTQDPSPHATSLSIASTTDSGFSNEPATPRSSENSIVQQQLKQRVARHESTIMHQLRVIKSLEERVMQIDNGSNKIGGGAPVGLGLTNADGHVVDDVEEILNGNNVRSSMQSVTSFRSMGSVRGVSVKPPPPTPPPVMPPPPPPTSLPNVPGQTPSSMNGSEAFHTPGSSIAHSPSMQNLGSSLSTMNGSHMSAASLLPLTTIKQMEDQEAMINTLHKQLTNAEADLQANIDLVNTLEASLNDSERNLRKTRLQMVELNKERDYLMEQVRALQGELADVRGEADKTRNNIQEEKKHFETWLEEERRAKERAERSRLALENRMEELMKRRSKFMCF